MPCDSMLRFMPNSKAGDQRPMRLVEPNGIQGARASKGAFGNENLSAGDIYYISAYGIATPSCDWSETRINKVVFGARAYRISISAIQSMLGSSWLALERFNLLRPVWPLPRALCIPPLNYTTPDSVCDLGYVPNYARHERIDTAITEYQYCLPLCQRYG